MVATSRGIEGKITYFLDLFRIDTSKPDLLQAQVKALSKQIPLLFFITVVNTIAVAFTHYGAAPNSLTIGFPIAITIGYAWRGLSWAKLAYLPISDRNAGQLIKQTIILAPACAAALMTWALVLFQYGDAYAQGHILFYAGVTVLSCTFCMTHLRPAALLMAGITVVPFAIFIVATGRPVFIAIVITMLLVSAGMIYILLVFSRDFAKMIDYQREMLASVLKNARLANTDSLTNLANRRKFLFTLQQEMGHERDEDQGLAVGLLNLDGFKVLNDLHGHAVGDSVLVEVGRRLAALCGRTPLIARLGGDKFGILFDENTSQAEIETLGLRICEAVKAPCVFGGAVIETSCSIGFAAFPQAGATADLLFERARYALRHAKQHLRGRATIFSIEHETEIRILAGVEHCLRHADLESEMSLHFQPIVDIEQGKTVAFEALARWVSPTLGRVAPDVFIRVAERSDLIHELTATLLRRALVEARTWPEAVRVSFNLSARDVASRESIAKIATIIETSGISPYRIDLEVTETAMIQDFEQANVSLRMLKALGIRISLDDFGIGYSSLSHIRLFPISKIKVDRSFVTDVETNTECRALVKSVIDMSRNLKLDCIVEGMETENQVRVLRSLGCKTMQGYFFGKPMPAAGVLDFLATSNLAVFLPIRTEKALAS